MLIDGNPKDEAKAREWVKAMKRQKIQQTQTFEVEDGYIQSGYKTTDTELNHLMKLAHARRDLNTGKRYQEISAMASFHPFAIRQYAARIGVKTVEMYRNPELMKRMIKDRDYAKFRLNDNAVKML